MSCDKNKIDSNVTGLRYAIERCLKLLWPSPIWNVLEPNLYNDFGANITTVARNPINPTRQRKKGSVTDLDATAGFTQDLTLNNSFALLQSFFFAKARERGTTASLNNVAGLVSGVTELDDTYAFSNTGVTAVAVVAGGTGYKVGDVLSLVGGTGQAAAVLRVATVGALGAVATATVLAPGQYSAAPASPAAVTGGSGVGATFNPTTGNNATFAAGELVFASGFGVAANNGIKKVVSQLGGTLTVDAVLADETPPAAAKLETVGFGFEVGDVDLAMNGNLVRLENAAAVDFTTLGINAGDWLFLGGDVSSTRFTNNYGFARVGVVSQEYLEFDKVSWANPAAESGAAVALHVYFGTVLKNESDPDLIVRQSVQLERTLGKDANGTMSEYIIGAVANEMTLNVAQASMVTVDLGFVGCDVEHRTGAEGVKAGARPSLEAKDAFNTTDNFVRIKLSSVDPATATPDPLFVFVTDLSLSVNNNVSPNKAVGTLGAFDTTAGTFEVGGELTVYFADVAGPLAVRQNLDMTLDCIMVKDNAGILFDMPLLALGGGIPNVEQDQSITLPLETNAAESKFGHTLLMQQFNYLPDIAG